MKLPRLAFLASLGLAASAAPASAGWNNVFLTNCWNCPPRTAQRPPAPAPRSDTTVEYERTSYSVPVTVMKPEKYTEEVPVQVKSYYYEPVTSYRTSYSLDECGRCQQVQVPCRTSWVKREQCETVMKAVERVRMVPVQMERIVTEVRPKYTTTHYGPIQRTTSPLQPVNGGAGAPGVDIEREPGAPDRIRPADVPMRMPGGTSVPKNLAPVPAPAPSQMTRKVDALTTSLKTTLNNGGTLTGEVIKNDKDATPLANAKLVFINAKNLDVREYVTADDYGQFDAKLAAGDWHLYLGHGNGKAAYHSKIRIADGERTSVKVQDR